MNDKSFLAHTFLYRFLWACSTTFHRSYSLRLLFCRHHFENANGIPINIRNAASKLKSGSQQKHCWTECDNYQKEWWRHFKGSKMKDRKKRKVAYFFYLLLCCTDIIFHFLHCAKFVLDKKLTKNLNYKRN